MSTKAAILIAAAMAVLSYANDNVSVRLSIRPAAACLEAAATAAPGFDVSETGATLRVPADGGFVIVEVARRES